MKKLFVAFTILFASTAFAGKMKEIHMLVTESVQDYLGFDEDVVKIEGYQFVKVEGADLAVETVARSYYSPQAPAPTFKCVTTFKKTGEDFSVIGTRCEEVR